MTPLTSNVDKPKTQSEIQIEDKYSNYVLKHFFGRIRKGDENDVNKCGVKIKQKPPSCVTAPKMIYYRGNKYLAIVTNLSRA